MRTREAAVGMREGPGDQTVWNLRGQEPDFWFSSELGRLWRTSTLHLASALEPPLLLSARGICHLGLRPQEAEEDPGVCAGSVCYRQCEMMGGVYL